MFNLRRWIASSIVCSVVSVAGWIAPVFAEVTLIGTAEISGTATDHSGLSEPLNDSIPANRIGGISAIEHLGGDEYLAQPDRGPLDGAVPFACRVQRLRITVRPGEQSSVTAQVVGTTMLTDESGRQLIGAKSAFDTENPKRSLRFDPEGLRVRGKRWFISDEYGPAVREFDDSGTLARRFAIPSRFTIAHPSKEPTEENAGNTTGRQANGGMEGLAISPDGKKLFAMMQRPLLQDSRLGDDGKRIGLFNRLLEIDVASGKTREFVYPLDKSSNGVSEILAINAHEFLLIERDSKEGLEATDKRITRIDVRGATDVSRVDILPVKELPSDIRPVRKSLFLDLLDPKFGLAGEHFPEKVEGLTFGPNLADGRRLLLIAVDNDFRAERPILIHAFAVSPDELGSSPSQ